PVSAMADMVMGRETPAGLGRLDCILHLNSTENLQSQFGVILEFKPIPNDAGTRNARSTSDGIIDEAAIDRQVSTCGEQLAKDALNQIIRTDYGTALAGCVERMYIGMAIGNNAVFTKTKLYKRPTTSSEVWTEVDRLR
ncbi:hypothetical protein IWW38_005310, partial [Coemansia aciculifera]